MKRRQFCTALVFSASLLVTLLSGCNNPTENRPTAGKPTLTLATEATYPPFEFYETAGKGEPIGFDIDIARSITRQLGYDLKITSMDFNGIIPSIQAKRADFAMAGITPTEERKKSVDFSDLYYQSKNVIITKKGSNIKKISDLAGKKLGVQLTTTQEQTAKKIASQVQGVQTQSLNDLGTVIQEIKVGRLDAGMMEDIVAKGYASTNPELEYFTINLDPQGLAIAFPKGSSLVPEFNRILKKMKVDGELAKLEQKWFEDYYKQQAAGKP